MRDNAWLMIGSALIGAVVAALITLVAVSDGDAVSQAELEDAIDDAVQSVISNAIQEALDPRIRQSDATASVRLSDAMQAQRTQITTVFDDVARSVVIIDAEGAERTTEEGLVVVSSALASGFLLDDTGHVVTAAHVLTDMSSFTVILANGVRRTAELVGDDRPFSDVGVLRFQPQDADELIVPRFAEGRAVSAGETVLAIGNILLGEEIAVTAGVVSNPDTTFFRERYEQDNLIQTDAALNHGNSGGILVDLDGEIVGMTAVIARSTQDGGFVDGVGFAVQIGPVLEVARAIAEDGFYPRPTFGVVNERLLTPAAAAQLDLSVTEGAFLIELKRDGAFTRAGIRPGDVLRRLNDTPINADTPYLNALATLKPREPALVYIHRDGEEYQLRIAPDLRSP